MKPYTTHTRIYIITPYTPWCMASREPLWPHPVQHIRARAHTHAHTTNPFNLTFQFERCFVIVYLRPQGLLQKRWVAEDVRHFSGWEKNCFASICAFVSPASLLSSLFSCFPSSSVVKPKRRSTLNFDSVCLPRRAFPFLCLCWFMFLDLLCRNIASLPSTAWTHTLSFFLYYYYPPCEQQTHEPGAVGFWCVMPPHR